jgi:hypothetical protein
MLRTAGVAGIRCTRVALAAALGLASCGGGGASGAPGTAQDRATVAGSPVLAARTSRAGEFAADFLRAAHFTSLVVEVDYPLGRAPAQAVLDLLRDRLAERCDKPDGVAIELDDAIALEEFPDPLADADLARLEDRHRHAYADEGTRTAAMYVLFVPGRAADDDATKRTMGTSYRGGSLALFLDACDQGTNLFVTTDEVVGTALVHEAGHLLGLVNRGVPMVADHEDRSHPGHDLDPTSVMFWYVEVPRVRPSLGDADFAQFGAACVADLRAFGGR